MKNALLKLLVCPETGGRLKLVGAERDGDEIVGGLLAAGRRRYPIIDGVPCFLNREQQIAAKQGFTAMWRYRQQARFERRNLYGIEPARKAEWVAGKFFTPAADGEWVMDAGCGSAETTHAFAKQHPDAQGVGLEFSDAVRQSAHGSEAVANLHFVQADVANPPFPAGTFGKVFSLGVLHHTPDTKTALQGAVKMLAAEAEILLWLYPAFGESFMTDQLYLMRDLQFFGSAHKLDPAMRLKAAQLYSLGMMPAMTAAYQIYKTLTKFGGPKNEQVLSEDMSLKELYETTLFSVYDNITPRYQHRHAKKEVIGWLDELGLVDTESDGRGLFTARMAVAATTA